MSDGEQEGRIRRQGGSGLSFIMPPPRGPKGRGVADRQSGGCISIFGGVFSLIIKVSSVD